MSRVNSLTNTRRVTLGVNVRRPGRAGRAQALARGKLQSRLLACGCVEGVRARFSISQSPEPSFAPWPRCVLRRRASAHMRELYALSLLC